VEREDGVYALEPDARGHVRGNRGVVEYGPYAGLDEGVDDFLCLGGGNGGYADPDGSCANGCGEGGEGLYCEVSNLFSGELGVGIEGGGDADSLWREAGVCGDGASEPSDADQGGVPCVVEAENSAELGGEVSHVVAAPLASEASEVAEVFSYLSGGYAEAGAEPLGAGDLDAAFCHLGEDAYVDREALNDHFGSGFRRRFAARRAAAGVWGHVWVEAGGRSRAVDGVTTSKRSVPFIT